MRGNLNKLKRLNQFDLVILKTLAMNGQLTNTKEIISKLRKLSEIYNFHMPNRPYLTKRLQYLEEELEVIILIKGFTNSYSIKEYYKSEISYLCRAYFDLWGKLRSSSK